MGSIRTLLVAAVIGWALQPAWAQDAAKPSQPYDIDVWAEVLFDTDGRLARIEVPEAAAYPAAFVERTKKHLANAKIPPVHDDSGAPATFLTGIRLTMRVSPAEGGGTVRIIGMGIAPRPIKEYAASRPSDVPANTPTSISVRCAVDVDGRCSAVDVLKADAGSEALRRWGVASMMGWVFAPQQVNGKPVPGEFSTTLILTIEDNKPPEFRRHQQPQQAQPRRGAAPIIDR